MQKRDQANLPADIPALAAKVEPVLCANMHAGVRQVLLIMLRKARARVPRDPTVDGRAGQARQRGVRTGDAGYPLACSDL